MEVQQDFRDLLELFNKYKVDYVIVGAYALGFHGAPRYTGDLHVFVRADPINARSIMQVKDLLMQIFQESELGAPKIELQELPTRTVFGTITSQTFSGKSLAHNIKVIWDIYAGDSGTAWNGPTRGRVRGEKRRAHSEG